MTTRNPLTNLIGTYEGSIQVLVLVVGLSIAILFWVIYRKYHLAVPPGQTAMVTKTRRADRISFLGPGHYILLPWISTLVGKISTRVDKAKGICQVITNDGYDIQLAWIIQYFLAPNTIDPSIHSSTAKIMLTDPTRMIDKFTEQCIHKIVERYPLDILLSGNDQSKVNDQIALAVEKCLAVYGICVENLRITTIKKPISNYHLNQRYGLTTKETAENLELTYHKNNRIQIDVPQIEDRKISAHTKQKFIHSVNPIGKLIM